eukprot:1831063-Prymnesium_polylepis.1
MCIQRPKDVHPTAKGCASNRQRMRIQQPKDVHPTAKGCASNMPKDVHPTAKGCVSNKPRFESRGGGAHDNLHVLHLLGGRILGKVEDEDVEDLRELGVLLEAHIDRPHLRRE